MTTDAGVATTTAASAVRPASWRRRRRRRPADRRHRLVDGRADLGRASPSSSTTRAPTSNVDVDGPGTGDGFALFCDGETDIADASRPIKEEEIAACEDGGIEFIELKIAFDGIVGHHDPANDTVECLSFADLYALLGPESEGFNNWTDAQRWPSELGSTTRVPDAAARRSPRRARSRAPTTPSSSSRSGGIAEARGDQEDRPRRSGPTTPRWPTTTSSSRASRATRRRSAGSASPSPREPATDQGARRSTAATAASSRRPRPSPTAATRCPGPVHLRERGQGRGEPGRLPLRRLLPQRTSSTSSVEEVGYVPLPTTSSTTTQATLGRPHHRHAAGG